MARPDLFIRQGNIPLAGSLRDSIEFASPAAHMLAVRNARAAREQSMTARSALAAECGRALMASEARDHAVDEAELKALSAILDRLERDFPGVAASAEARGLDRTGVVAPQGSSARRNDNLPILGRTDRLADWPSVRNSAGDDDEPVRLGNLVRAWVSGARDGLSPAEFKALSEGTASAGGVLVPAPTAAGLIDRARNVSRVMQAGASTIAMDSSTLKIPRLTGSTAPAWRLENAAVATGDMVFDSVSLTAKSLAFIVKISRELIEDSDPDVVNIVERDLAAQVASEIDRVALRGSGTDPEPRGIRNTTGVTITSLGANGASPTYDALIDAVQAIRAQNFEPNAVITTPRAETSLSKLKDAQGNYLRPPAMLEDMPRYTTNQIPVNQTQGTSTNASEIYVGEWPMLYVGIRTGPMTIQLVERFADFGQVALMIWFRGDIAAAQPGAFAVLTGVTP